MNDTVNDTPEETTGTRSAIMWVVPLFIAAAVIVLAWSAVTTAAGPPAAAPETTTPSGGGSGTTAPSGGGDADLVSKGEEIYSSTCSACHGADAKGIPGLGKDLTNSEFIQGLSDDELVDFMKVGRGASDPENTTGVAMPPKGGNPSLTDDDLRAVVAFLRTLQ